MRSLFGVLFLCLITGNSFGSVIGFSSRLEREDGTEWALQGQHIYRDDTGEIKYGWVSLGPYDAQTNTYEGFRTSASIFEDFDGFVDTQDPLVFWEFETLVFDQEAQTEGLIEFSINVQGIDYLINRQRELFRFTELVGSIFPPGDWNGSGTFDSSDLIKAFQEGLYETGAPAHFGQGDSNGDKLFNSSDFTYSLAYGEYNSGAANAKSFSVPEPHSLILFVLSLPFFRLIKHDLEL